jgi:predicted RNA-binding protein YlxR (DUF448 family)
MGTTFNMKRGHVPIRMCIVCRQRLPAVEMLRLKASEDIIVVSSWNNRYPGRGCYTCPTETCVDAALKNGRLQRALRRSTAVTPSKEELLRGLQKKG